MLAATERHVQLVIVGGRPVYGNRSLLERAGVTGAEPITVAGIRRAVVMDLPEDAPPDRARPPRRGDEVVADGHAGARRGVEGSGPGGAQRARDSRAFGVEPLQFVPDLPGPDGGEARALTDDELDQLAMPTFDGIGHTAAWFERVRRSCPDHAEILCDLGDEF